MIGATIAGVGVCLIALSVSLPVCLAIPGLPVGRGLPVGPQDHRPGGQGTGSGDRGGGPAGGALLGIVGALVAIPAAAALLLLTREALFPRLDLA